MRLAMIVGLTLMTALLFGVAFMLGSWTMPDESILAKSVVGAVEILVGILVLRIIFDDLEN